MKELRKSDLEINAQGVLEVILGQKVLIV